MQLKLCILSFCQRRDHLQRGHWTVRQVVLHLMEGAAPIGFRALNPHRGVCISSMVSLEYMQGCAAEALAISALPGLRSPVAVASSTEA